MTELSREAEEAAMDSLRGLVGSPPIDKDDIRLAVQAAQPIIESKTLGRVREALVSGRRYERVGHKMIEWSGGEWFHARDVLAALNPSEE